MKNPFNKGDRVKLCRPWSEAIQHDELLVDIKQNEIYVLAHEVHETSQYIRINGWLLLWYNFELAPQLKIGFIIDLDTEYV